MPSLPASFQGTWAALASFEDVRLPLGPRFLSRGTPGVTKGSIMAALPDVGAAQDRVLQTSMRWVEAEEGGVVADR